MVIPALNMNMTGGGGTLAVTQTFGPPSRTAIQKNNSTMIPKVQSQYHTVKNSMVSAPKPEDFFEPLGLELDNFDRKFSKTALRHYKYPKIELERMQKLSLGLTSLNPQKNNTVTLVN